MLHLAVVFDKQIHEFWPATSRPLRQMLRSSPSGRPSVAMLGKPLKQDGAETFLLPEEDSLQACQLE